MPMPLAVRLSTVCDFAAQFSGRLFSLIGYFVRLVRGEFVSR